MIIIWTQWCWYPYPQRLDVSITRITTNHRTPCNPITGVVSGRANNPTHWSKQTQLQLIWHVWQVTSFSNSFIFSLLVASQLCYVATIRSKIKAWPAPSGCPPRRSCWRTPFGTGRRPPRPSYFPSYETGQLDDQRGDLESKTNGTRTKITKQWITPLLTYLYDQCL